jgi:DNA-binding protein HU-beta
MNKSELIERIAEKSGLSKADAGKALAGFTDTVTEALKDGNSIALVGFGTFSVSDRPERQGRNPATGESMTILAKRVAKFKVGKGLDDAINN